MFMLSCDRINITTLTVVGAILYPETQAKITGAYGVFVVATADIDYYDRNAIPEISPPQPDTSLSFGQIELPSFLHPESGGEVLVNTVKLNEEYEGQYQGEIQNLEPGDSVFIKVTTQKGDTGFAKITMPTPFTISISDTVIVYDSLSSSLDIAWTSSQNANAYMILLYSIDTTNESIELNLKEITEDTTYSIPKDNLSPNTYLIQVASICGKINASMPQTGSLIGILGQVATMYIKEPVLIKILE